MQSPGTSDRHRMLLIMLFVAAKRLRSACVPVVVMMLGGRSKFALVGRVKFDLGYEGLFQDGGVMNAEYHLDMLAM